MEKTYKYIAVDNCNNKYFVNNLFYKKFINDHGCRSVVYYDNQNNLILAAERLADGRIIKY